jgi:hypothetical protein
VHLRLRGDAGVKTIHLAPGIDTGLATLVDTRCLVQANSGGGKSWCLRRLLEQSHGAVQHLVLDPEGEFASLRERFDYILAAKHGGDTAAEPRAAGLLAQRLLELGVSAIVDLYELKAHDRVRFVGAFLEALVDAPKKLWHPALVVLDEAHVFCPQQGEAESAGAVIDLCTRGRKRGFGSVLATQRLSKLHKDAAAELNNKLIGRTGLDVDVKRAADELGFGKERWRELRELEAGEFFVFGPAMSREVRKVRIGPVETTHPKAGARLAFTAPPPTDRIRALLPKLSDLPAEQERKLRTEADLRAEMTLLRAQLSAAERRAPAPAKPEVREVPVLKDAQVKRLEAAIEKLDAIRDRTAQAQQVVASEAGMLASTIRAAMKIPAERTATVPVALVRRASAPPVPLPRRERAATDGNGHLSGPEQRILDALAWLESIGIREAQQPAAAFLAGYTIGGGAWNNPKGKLRGRGLIAYLPGDRLALTEEGHAQANTPDVPLTVEDLHAKVFRRLPGPEGRILRALIEAYPEAVANEDLAQRAGYEAGGGAFNNPKGRLRGLGLIDYPSPGQVVALPVLFLEGQRAC